MSETHESWVRRVGQTGLVARAVILLMIFLIYVAAILPIAGSLYGRQGVWAASLATGICVISGWLALLLGVWVFPPAQPAAHVLSGMLVRMSPPLLTCLWVSLRHVQLAEAGFALWLVGAFCVGLAAETLFTVAQLQSGLISSNSMTGPTSAPQESAGEHASRRDLGGTKSLAVSPQGTEIDRLS